MSLLLPLLPTAAEQSELIAERTQTGPAKAIEKTDREVRALNSK